MKKMTALLLSAALLCPTLALAEDTVKIGIFEPMTGATAAGGSMEKEGFDLANELYPDVLGQKIELGLRRQQVRPRRSDARRAVPCG